MKLGPAKFVYFYRESGMAILCTHRDDCTTGILLFTCPEAWAPTDQASFVAAAAYYGVRDPQRMKYDPNEVPF